ncbi:MAG: hypothetical protein ACRDHL_06985 [Candidatus Promineifilaceae bacterium]
MTSKAGPAALDQLLEALPMQDDPPRVALVLLGREQARAFRLGPTLVLEADGRLHDWRRLKPAADWLVQLAASTFLLVGGPEAVANYVFLDPLLPDLLGEAACGYLAAGPAARPDGRDWLAEVAYSLWQSSAFLCRQRPPDGSSWRASGTLGLLATHLLPAAARDGQQDGALIGLLHSWLAARTADLPDLAWTNSDLSGAPALLPELQAIYELDNDVTLVLPDLPPEKAFPFFGRVEWPAIGESLSDAYERVLLATPAQFQLLAEFARPLDLHLKRFQHVWGLNPLLGLEPAPWRLARDLALSAYMLGLHELPLAYLACAEPELPNLVHHFSNRLLNIQLRSELYARSRGQTPEGPAQPLPGRHASYDTRIGALLDHLHFWAERHRAEAIAGRPAA